MAVRRDYGAFGRAAGKRLAPRVKQFGYRQVKGASFARDKADWIEGFSLHQSAWGSGDIYLSIGLAVPALDTLLGNPPDGTTFVVGGRTGGSLTAEGKDSYPAADSVELDRSIDLIVDAVQKADAWFARFESMLDVAKLHQSFARGDYAITSQALLFMLAGDKETAREKLEYAHRRWQKIVSDDRLETAKRRPGKEAAAIYQGHEEQLEAIESLLRQHFGDPRSPALDIP